MQERAPTTPGGAHFVARRGGARPVSGRVTAGAFSACANMSVTHNASIGHACALAFFACVRAYMRACVLMCARVCYCLHRTVRTGRNTTHA